MRVHGDVLGLRFLRPVERWEVQPDCVVLLLGHGPYLHRGYKVGLV